MVTVAVDANGADLGPAEVAEGAAQAVRGRDLRVLLYADAAAVGSLPEGVELRDAPVSIAKSGDPASSVRTTPQASVVQAAKAVATGEADAFVTGGATGAALAAGVLHIRRQPGIHRPALAMMVPIPGAPVLLLDVGASTEARPERLVQHAHMGAAFASSVFGVSDPRVALLSNGQESSRGNPAVVEANSLLSGDAKLDFVGNIEGVAIGDGIADVVVTDGFTGNVALKLMEGVSSVLIEAIRSAAGSDARSAAGALLLRPALSGLRDSLDPEAHGGAYLLGLRSVGVVAHGRFTRRGFARAIEVAAEAVENRAIELTHAALGEAGVLRRAPASN